MKEGSIILTAIVQVDGQVKNRPALILREMPRYGDFLICGISTQLRQYIPNFDEIISPDDEDFISSGLVKTSLVRLAFLSVIPKQQAIGSIGSISIERHHRLLSNLSSYLLFQSLP